MGLKVALWWQGVVFQSLTMIDLCSTQRLLQVQLQSLSVYGSRPLGDEHPWAAFYFSMPFPKGQIRWKQPGTSSDIPWILPILDPHIKFHDILVYRYHQIPWYSPWLRIAPAPWLRSNPSGSPGSGASAGAGGDARLGHGWGPLWPQDSG